MEDSEELIEAKAVERAWLDLAIVENGAKPLQIGLYMHSIYGDKSINKTCEEEKQLSQTQS